MFSTNDSSSVTHQVEFSFKRENFVTRNENTLPREPEPRSFHQFLCKMLAKKVFNSAIPSLLSEFDV